MENPFAGLRPEMRSEHDEIRKGIFSRALRNMQSSPLSERREWCRAIRATYAAAQAAREKRAAATGTSSATTTTSAQTSLSAPNAPAVGTKRTHMEAGLSGTTPSSAPLAGTATEEASLTTSSANTGASVVEEQEPEEESEASVKECIAAYLRSLLDRVVGVSLENLNVPALRILCTMVGIQTEVRNKIGLYSTLASFYYTECEKLGKRVSKDTVFERQVEQEAAMLRRAAANTASSTTATSASKRAGDKKVQSASAEHPASSSSSTRVTTTSTNGGTSSSGTSKASPAAVVVSVTSHRLAKSSIGGRGEREKVPSVAAAPLDKSAVKVKRHSAAAAAASSSSVGLTHYLEYEHVTKEEEEWSGVGEAKPPQHHHRSHTSAYEEENEEQRDEEEGEVVFEERVFARRGEASPSSGNAKASPHMAKYAAAPAEDDAWSTPMLERKVASIVQLHDPVTVAIVVKKLAQLGYRGANVESLVEQILRRFHDRQLIFYDNGIAYLM